MMQKRLVWMLIITCALSLAGAAQDEGFEIIYEGYADEETTGPLARLDVTLYGTAGLSAGSAFWASAGGRATFVLGDFEIRADASIGTDGITVQAGTTTEIAGFGVAGDATWSPGGAPVIDLRGWGALADIQVTANVRVAGRNSTLNLGLGTDLDGLGLSANLGLTAAGINQASAGANLQLGDATVSGSAGLAAGRFSTAAGIGLVVGPINVTASAGYDGAYGLNAMAGGGLESEAFRATAIALYDNTGVGAELSSELDLGSATALLMARFGGTSLSVEVGGRLPMGKSVASASVAVDTRNGFSWAEVGFEMPL